MHWTLRAAKGIAYCSEAVPAPLLYSGVPRFQSFAVAGPCGHAGPSAQQLPTLKVKQILVLKFVPVFFFMFLLRCM